MIYMNNNYYVSKKGSDNGDGSIQHPFLTINHAAKIATAGDTVLVHEGIYREWVSPSHSGLDNYRRITFQSVPGEKVTITGSEEIKGWELIRDGVWKVNIPETLFGTFNPFREEVFGDWLFQEKTKKHLGDVYLNGMSFYEANDYDDLFNVKIRTEVVDQWTQQSTPIVNSEQTKYVWFAEVSHEQTTLYANFHDFNPNENCVEINVRQSCFSPKKTGIDYITIRGFEICQAACPWTPPTSDQIGMVSPHWSKGWIIEDNVLHDAKCSAISIGKEGSTGHNHHSIRFDKTGHQYQLESVFLALQKGWKKETIGSHIIRNNTIYDCGQNGIVGHLGCIYSTIQNNHIYNIAMKREFYGYEIAGIKLHAPIDVEISHNRIHHCSLGTWLDWQTQGTRIHHNIFHDNNRDFFVEVSHGPYIVDHNIFASPSEFDNFSQGGAYLHNLFCGPFRIESVLDRVTPYHFPHSTEMAGFSFVYTGDDRFINNIFVKPEGVEREDFVPGTVGYNDYPTSFEEYQTIMRDDVKGLWEGIQNVFIENNAYFNGAMPFDKEKENYTFYDFNPNFQLMEKADGLYLSFELPSNSELKGEIISTKKLGHTRLVGAPFDSKDGMDLSFDTDFMGMKRTGYAKVGPFQQLIPGENHIRIW